MSSFFTLFCLLVIFGRNCIGTFNNPYVTYRKLSAGKVDVRQLIYLFILVISYFIFASLIRIGVRNPFLLTVRFNTLFLGAATGFLGMLLALFYLGKKAGGQGEIRTMVILWGYSLIPTLFWFFLTSIIYIILPPPRSASIPGRIFSLVFIALSLAILWWKIILYYLTLRFGLKLGLYKITLVSVLAVPLILAYSVSMYKLGIFRIPFL